MAEQNQDKTVVGLKYIPGEGLPQVILKGRGETAERMLQARTPWSGPPVVQDKQLAEQLYRLPIDSQIGPELFQIVALLLAHVFAIEGKLNGVKS